MGDNFYMCNMKYTQAIIGLAITIFGVFVILGPVVILSEISYPIIWWGILIFVDYLNFRRWGESLMRGHSRKFFGILLPFSVLYWLYFEFANFVYPQWYYVGIFENTVFRVIFAIFTFGTVVPIIIEIFWLFLGSVSLPRQIKFPARYLIFFIALGAVFSALPFVSDNFILNQMMWLAPFFIFFPLFNLFSAQGAREAQSKSGGEIAKRFIVFVALSGIISGFLWEFLNFWSAGKWKYLVLPDAFHIFEMPIYGYIGFIPFAFSSVIFHIFIWRFLKPRFAVIIPLYISAIVASYAFVMANS